MSRQPISQSDLKRAFQFHLRQISDSINKSQEIPDQLVSGALSARVLLHDFEDKSLSLLSRLEIKSQMQFLSSTPPSVTGNPIGILGLGTLSLTKEGPIYRYADLQLFNMLTHFVDFDTWWEGEKVLFYGQNKYLTRRGVILMFANKIGAHVDSFTKNQQLFVTDGMLGTTCTLDNGGEIAVFDSQVLPTLYTVLLELRKTLRFSEDFILDKIGE